MFMCFSEELETKLYVLNTTIFPPLYEYENII